MDIMPIDNAPSIDEMLNNILELQRENAALKAEVEKLTAHNIKSDAIALWLDFLESYRNGIGMNGFVNRHIGRIDAVLAQRAHIS